MTRLLPALSLPLLVLAAACGSGGTSSSEAHDQVCSAKADINKQIETLGSMTLSSATTDDIKNAVTAIQDDLTTISKAQSHLSGDQKSQVQSANQAFKSQLSSISSNLFSSLSLSDAQKQLQSAATDLANAYKQSLNSIKC